MTKKIISAYLYTICLASGFGTVILSVFSGIVLRGDVLEIIMYFLRGLALSLFFLPILITLLITYSIYRNLDIDSLKEKLNITHVFATILWWFIGNFLFYKLGHSSGLFFELQFTISFLLIIGYAIFAYFGWRIAFRN